MFYTYPPMGYCPIYIFGVHINIFERSFIDKNPVYLSYKTVYTVFFFFIFYLKHIFYYIKRDHLIFNIIYSADIACIFVVLRNVGFRLDWYLHSSCYFIFTFLLFFFFDIKNGINSRHVLLFYKTQL